MTARTGHGVLVAALAAFLGCSDDDVTGPDPEPTLVGTWRVVSVERPPISRGGPVAFLNEIAAPVCHLVVDASRIQVVAEWGIGFRDAYETTYEAGDGILIEGVNLELSGSAEHVVLQRGEVRVELARADDAPAPETWIVDYRPLVSTNTVFQSEGDLAWDGARLWVSGGPDEREVSRIDPATLTASIVEIDGAAPSAIEFLGATAIVNDDATSNLYRFDPASGEAGSPGDAVAFDIRGIAYDGTLVWCLSPSSRRMYLYDPDAGEVLDAFDIGSGFAARGAHYRDYTLYVAGAGNVTAFDIVREAGQLPRLVARGAFRLPGHDIVGVTHDGTDFWVNTRVHATGAMRLHEITPL